MKIYLKFILFKDILNSSKIFFIQNIADIFYETEISLIGPWIDKTAVKKAKSAFRIGSSCPLRIYPISCPDCFPANSSVEVEEIGVTKPCIKLVYVDTLFTD